MDMMEHLLCPQVCMDVEETAIELNKSYGADVPDIPPEADTSTLPEELRVRMILDNDFHFEDTQIPKPLLPAERIVFSQIINEKDHFERNKLHCTACNKHLGCAAVNQFDRYIHPLLNVVICKNCLKFYGTGDFEKDEDGSELYCKWCAQGGTVMCCSVCPLVYCSICVRRNLGQPKLTEIKNSDTWKCFYCDPEQLSNFHITAHVLYGYVQKQIKAAIATKNMQLLKLEHGSCCKTRRKRKNSDDENEEFTLKKPKPKSKNPAPLKLLAPKDIIKPPGAVLVNKAINNVQQLQPNLLFQSLQLQSLRPTADKPLLNFRVINPRQQTSTGPPTLAQLMPNIFHNNAVPSTSKTNNLNKNISIRAASVPALAPLPILRQKLLAKPPLKHVVSKPTNTSQNIMTDWLSNSVLSTNLACKNLLTESNDLLQQGRFASSNGDLATLHNKMQNAIVQCTSKMIETRKAMHREFLKYLNKINVRHSTSVNGNGNQTKTPVKYFHKTLGNSIQATFNDSSKNDKTVNVKKLPITAEIDLCDDDEDVPIISGQFDTIEKDPLSMDDDDEDAAVLPDFQEEVILIVTEDPEKSDESEKSPKTPITTNKSVTESKKKRPVSAEVEEIVPECSGTVNTNCKAKENFRKKQKAKQKEMIKDKGNENETENVKDKITEKNDKVVEESAGNIPVAKEEVEEVEGENNYETDVSVEETAGKNEKPNEIDESVDKLVCNFRESIENVYRECVEENAKIHFDFDKMSRKDFMRAIKVRSIVNKKVLRDLNSSDVSSTQLDEQPNECDETIIEDSQETAPQYSEELILEKNVVMIQDPQPEEEGKQLQRSELPIETEMNENNGTDDVRTEQSRPQEVSNETQNIENPQSTNEDFVSYFGGTSTSEVLYEPVEETIIQDVLEELAIATSEPIAETVHPRADFDSNDNVKNAVDELVDELGLGQIEEEVQELAQVSENPVDYALAGINFYDACDTTIDGDMVPPDV